MKTMKLAISTAAVAMLALSAMSSSSTNIVYGDYTAADVTFLGVEEYTTTLGDTVPKYGAPIVSTTGNTMDFNPVGFEATAGGGGVDFTDGNLVFIAEAHPNMAIEEIAFSEAGTFTLQGLGTENTYVDVTARFFIDIYEVNFVDLPSAIRVEAYMDFNPSTDGTFDFPTYGPEDDGSWSGELLVDINYELSLRGFDPSDRATSVGVDLNNYLTAISEAGSIAAISKKDFDTGLSIEIIPEPASLALLIGASSLIVYVRRHFID